MLTIWALLLVGNITCMAITYKNSCWFGFGLNTAGVLCCVYNILKLQDIFV
jgi:hypothetical protein